MKITILASLLVVFSIQPTIANETENFILCKYSTAGARPPKYRNNRRVDIFPSGKVHVIGHRGLKEAEYSKKVSAETIENILECKKKIKNEKQSLLDYIKTKI